MDVFRSPDFSGHERVVFCHDRQSGLQAIIAIHDTTLGPALGGCRMWPYASEEEAVTDVLRLARGMTYKAAAAGLDLGGGKSVIIGDPRRDRTEARLRAFGRFVDSLGGRYVVAEDVGITVADMQVVRQETPHVAGIGSGDPSPATAYGVLMGMRAAVRFRLGRDTLSGLRVAVQGLGKVGYALCRLLAAEDVRLIVADLDPEAVGRAREDFKAEAVDPAVIHAAAADIFAPCALGAVVNDATLPQLAAPVIAGSANNQLAEARHGRALMERGILYAPDYVINAGGLINVSFERAPGGYDRRLAFRRIEGIHDTLMEIFARSRATGEPTSAVADRLAERRFRKAA